MIVWDVFLSFPVQWHPNIGDDTERKKNSSNDSLKLSGTKQQQQKDGSFKILLRFGRNYFFVIILCTLSKNLL